MIQRKQQEQTPDLWADSWSINITQNPSDRQQLGVSALTEFNKDVKINSFCIFV